MNFFQNNDSLQSIDDWLDETSKDDRRRFNMFRNLIENKRLLDFGCGNGGFLLQSKSIASDLAGVELEKRIQKYWQNRLLIYPTINNINSEYDLITAFHVLEHLSDPIKIIRELSELLSKNGMILIEVPNSEDVLLTLYDCEPYQNFTYWSGKPLYCLLKKRD